MADLKLIGPWVTYSDPRILPSISFANWGAKIQVPLLQGEIPWRVDPAWNEYGVKAWDNLHSFLSERRIAVEVNDGIAWISDPRFAPVDDVTRETCRLHRLCDQESLKAGTYRLAFESWDVWIKSAVAFPEEQWFCGVPLVEMEFYGRPHGLHAIVGRLDVREIEISHHGRRSPGRRIKPGLLRAVDMSRPRWRYSAKVIAAKVAEHLPTWDAWLREKAEGEAFIEARRAEAETRAVIAEAESDEGLMAFATQINHPVEF